MSRIGRMPIAVPAGVTVDIAENNKVTVKGPKGTLERAVSYTHLDGEKSYILAPEGLKVGMKVMNGENAEARVGNCLPLSAIPIGAQVHNIELLSLIHI